MQKKVKGNKGELYCISKDADVQLDCLDIVALKLNDFTQAFRDLVIFIRKKDGATKTGKSLRYSITSYDTLGFQQTDSEKDLLRELTIRNEITHDYFNYELHQQKLIWIIENCSKGAMDVYENLFNYCQEQNLLDCYVNNGEK